MAKTWCVCGRRSDEESYEKLECGLRSENAGIAWLKKNHGDYPNGYTFYVDREDNDNPADLFAHVCNGELCFEYGSGQPANV